MSHISHSDYYVADADKDEARAFIRAHHYSKGCSNTHVYLHGMFCANTDKLMGVAHWLPPTRVAAESVNKDQWKRVLSLSRLVVHPDVPTNGASFLLGRSIRLIRSEGKWVSLVTYADDFMGHTGQIYRATNWEYVGRMKGSPRWENAEGRQVARKSTRSRTNAEMEALGLRMVGVFDKHKFVRHLHQRRKPLGNGVL
ncbi:MAG: hypothetical protein KGL39_38390 [Patescibacteria group bacterium]|nr:hypothetical protein [Patescibacteria group bacterium]